MAMHVHCACGIVKAPAKNGEMAIRCRHDGVITAKNPPI